MSGVSNDFTLSGAPAGTVGVFFYFFRDIPTQPLWTQPDFAPSNGWIQAYDMGNLVPGTKLQAFCVNVLGDTIAQSPTIDIAVLPEPSWLRDAALSGITISGRNISMRADYPINTHLNRAVPNDIAGIGGRTYNLFDPLVRINITYSLDSRTSTVSRGALVLGINLFNQHATYRNIPLPIKDISLDQDFNLRMKAADSVYARLFALNIPLFYLPLPFFSDIRFDAGVTIDGMLKGQVVVGNDGGQWGFVRDSTEVTSLVGKLQGIGFVRGEFDVLGGLVASVEGKLSVYGELGGGVDYVSVPNSQATQAFGGNLAVYGELRATAFLFIPVGHIGPKELYSTSFGQIPGRAISVGDGGPLKATTVLIDSTPPIPRHAPQPAMDAYRGRIGTVWIEDANNRTSLQFSSLDGSARGFRPPVLIQNNDRCIGSPSLAIRQDGSAFIAWTQNRYSPATVPATAGLRNLLAAQDVYVALYDATSSSVASISMIPDDTTSFESGRAEAEPKILAMDDDHGMVIWLAQEGERGSRLWYSVFQRNGTRLTVGNPMPLSTTKGMNRSPQLVKLNGGTMLAVWTNDSDSVDTTFDARILSSLWDGSSWSAPAEVIRAGNRETFARTTLAANSNYAILGWTSTERDTNGAFLSGIDIRVWDIANAHWVNTSGYTARDSAAYIQNPAVSIGDGGKVVVSYQRVPRSDSVAINEGRRALLLRNANDPSGTWKGVPGFGMLSDTNAYVWTARTAFDAGDDYYSLTEEQQRDATTKPIAGIRFGSPELGLVMRRVHVGSDLSIDDVDEPEAPSGIQLTPHEDALSAIQISPNPTRSDILITYSINQAASVTIQLIDVTGRSLGSILDESLEAGTYQTHISTAELASGVYWVIVRNGAEIQRMAIRVVK